MASLERARSVSFRYGGLHDVPDMHSLDERLFASHTSYDLETFHGFMMNPAITTITACDSGKMAGYIIVAIGMERAANILTIDVEPAYQRCGVGSRLMTLGEKHARREGAQAIFLQVSVVNHGAIKFYDKLGFSKTRLMRDYYASAEDGWEMKKVIADPSQPVMNDGKMVFKPEAL